MPYSLATYRWLFRMFVMLFGSGGLAMGVAMVAGGQHRFNSPGFATANLVPGGVNTWGALIAVPGLLTLLGVARRYHTHLLRAGLLGEAFWFWFFDISLIYTTWTNPNGPITGCVAYFVLTVACLVLWGVASYTRERP